jgi:hypothetical protein
MTPKPKPYPINKILQAHADLEAAKIEAGEKLEPLIMKSKLHRTPEEVVRMMDIALLRKENIEIKGG